jgi:hypothetical protein
MMCRSSRIMTFSVLFSLLPAAWLPGTAMAQSEKTIAKAERLVSPDADPERVRKAFQMLADEMREKPALTNPAGLWLHADAAAVLALNDGRGTASILVALESYERAAKLPDPERDLDIFTRLEARLHDKAQSFSSAQKRPEQLEALEYAQLYLRADDIRVSLDRSRPVERARRYMLAVSAALAADEVRVARKLFVQLDEMGGFIEDLAIRVAAAVEAQESAHTAFLFLRTLHDNHPKHRNLLEAYLDLCIENGWTDEAIAALADSADNYQRTYEDQMTLGGYHDRLDDLAAARKCYERALVHAPKGFDANRAYADVLRRQALATEDPEAQSELRALALDALRLVLASNPDHVDAQRALASLEARIAEDENGAPADPTDDGGSDADDASGQ